MRSALAEDGTAGLLGIASLHSRPRCRAVVGRKVEGRQLEHCKTSGAYTGIH